MSRILIIPDLHLKEQIAERVIANVEHDSVIFGGDYFHQFNDTADQNANAFRWLRGSVDQPDRHHLLGNHDLCHMFPQDGMFGCAGYTREKELALIGAAGSYDKKLAVFKKLSPFLVAQGFLFSHAGLTLPLYDDITRNGGGQNLASVAAVLAGHCNFALAHAAHGTTNGLLMAGWSRGGYQPHGGILWCDYDKFEPIPGVNQIFFHTALEKPHVKFLLANQGVDSIYNEVDLAYDDPDVAKILLGGEYLSVNYCLDSHLRHFALLENGAVTIYNNAFYHDSKPSNNNENCN